jgi:hypothetical protein
VDRSVKSSISFAAHLDFRGDFNALCVEEYSEGSTSASDFGKSSKKLEDLRVLDGLF